jgi:hypothetical protein
MKLHKGLKLRKKLVGEIAKLKEQIKAKNSYSEGSVDPQKYNVNEIYAELLKKTDELISLKYVINEANREIQDKIFRLSEFKSLLTFWNEVPVVEGAQIQGYSETRTVEYHAQIDELRRNEMVAEFQGVIDAIQDEIDTYNYTTEIPWGDEEKPVISDTKPEEPLQA